MSTYNVCGTKCAITTEDFPQMLPTKFRFIWPNGFRGEESNFFNSFLLFNDFFSLIFKFQKRQRPCLLADLSGMSNSHRGPPIDASYQVSVHLANQFQRRRFFQKSSNQKQELSMVAIFVNGSGQNEQSQQRTFHRCFLPSFGSFG